MSEPVEPANKKLRSSEPDLVVVVGVDDEQKEYHYDSQVLATHSKVIDVMLASSMRESQTGRINFPYLSAEVWEAMNYFLLFLPGCQMTVQDALQVAAAYDQYDVCAGVECCDQVFFEFFGTIMPNDRCFDRKLIPKDLDQVIDVFVLADAANLKQTKELAVQYFKGALESALKYGTVIFSTNQIKKLVPLIVKENLLEHSSFTKDEILQSLFPTVFVASAINSKSSDMLGRAIVGLRLTGTECKADGVFIRDLPGFFSYEKNTPIVWDGVELSMKIDKLDDDWVIFGETAAVMEFDEDEEEFDDDDSIERKVLWKNPLSELPFPPESGWVPVDTLARGEPRIHYIYRSNAVRQFHQRRAQD